jgi:hypothetical protein
MQSEIGITPRGLEAVKNLEIQEKGGTIKNRSVIYMDTARVGRAKNKRVRRPNYLKDQGKVTGSFSRARTRKSRFVASAIVSERENKTFRTRSGGQDVILRADRVSFQGRGVNRSVDIRVTPIATYKSGRSVSVNRRPFLETASIRSFGKAVDIFIKNAQRRFERAIR